MLRDCLAQGHQNRHGILDLLIIPEGNYKQIKDNDSSIKIRGVKSIQEAMQLVFS